MSQYPLRAEEIEAVTRLSRRHHGPLDDAGGGAMMIQAAASALSSTPCGQWNPVVPSSPCTCPAAYSGNPQAHGPDCPRRPELEAAASARKILSVLTEPLGLSEAELDAQYPHGKASGTQCITCLGPHRAANRTRCVYCIALEQLRTSRPAPRWLPPELAAAWANPRRRLGICLAASTVLWCITIMIVTAVMLL